MLCSVSIIKMLCYLKVALVVRGKGQSMPDVVIPDVVSDTCLMPA